MAALARMAGMRRLLVLPLAAAALAWPSPVAAISRGRPVALVTAETANEVLAVSLGPHGGRILRRVHLADPLMIAAPLHGPAVVVNPAGTVTLLGWHSLRPIKVFRSFRSPKVAAVAPDGRFAYVTDERTGDLSVIDLARRAIVGRVFVGREAHHLGISPDGRRIWVALGETATTIVRLDASNPLRPRVVGRVHPPAGAHDVAFPPGGRQVWASCPSAPLVTTFSAATGRTLTAVQAGPGPQHLVFAAGRALVTSGYDSTLESISIRTHEKLRVARTPYGSFNLATYGGFVVTTSLFTGQVSELRVGDLHRLWTTKVAPAARYVAISVWPR
jgi:DNA-binding beta-propeller fold protein YncE